MSLQLLPLNLFPSPLQRRLILNVQVLITANIFGASAKTETEMLFCTKVCTKASKPPQDRCQAIDATQLY